MAQVSCPSCKRKGTYSPKNKQCAACGLGYTVTPVTPVTPVTEHRTGVAPAVTNVTTATPVTEDRVVSHSGFPPDPGEVCPLCDERKPSEKALKQRKYRERKEG